MTQWQPLTSNTLFRTLYYRGKSRSHPALVTYVRKNRLGFPRVGITTGKKLGGAVMRSRCRRVIREAFRPQYHKIGGWDIVFVARSRLTTMKSTQLAPVIESHLRQMGVLSDG
jgi:ribonuclease P protein component